MQHAGLLDELDHARRLGGVAAERLLARDADEPALLRAAYNLQADAPMPEEVAAEVVAAEAADVAGEVANGTGTGGPTAAQP